MPWTLSEPGRIFFVATRMLYSPLFIYRRLWEEGWLDDLGPRALGWGEQFDTVIYYASQLERLPFEVEPCQAAEVEAFLADIQAVSEAWESGDFLFQLVPPPRVDAARYVYEAYIGFLSQIFVLFVGFMNGHRMDDSPYPNLYTDLTMAADDCIERLMLDLGTPDDTPAFGDEVAEEIGMITMQWALHWHGSILEMAYATD